jgi:hypothetical protein
VATKNDVTGDSLVSKPLSKDGEENWDRIFGKKIREQKLTVEDMDQLSMPKHNNNGRSSES